MTRPRASVRVEVRGDEEAIATLRRIEHEADHPPAAVGQVLAGAIALEAPYQTGYLRSSVTPLEDASVVVEAPYAVYVNARDPFVSRGAARARGPIVETWQSHVDDAIRREGATP